MSKWDFCKEQKWIFKKSITLHSNRAIHNASLRVKAKPIEQTPILKAERLAINIILLDSKNHIFNLKIMMIL